MDSPLRPSSLPSQDNPNGIHDWATLAISEGEVFLKSQPGYDQTDEIIRGIMGTTYEKGGLSSGSFSNLAINHFGKIALDEASALTDIKPFFTYKCSNTRYEPQAIMGQKLATAWWLNRSIDLKNCDVIKYALAGGSSYAHLIYNPDTSDLDMQAEDPRDVLPIRPTDMISVQNCFGIVIRRERTVNYLKQFYPRFANRIHADRDGSYAALSKNRVAQQQLQNLGMMSGFMSNLYGMMSRSKAQTLTVPVSDVFTIYVKDESLNRTANPVLMGDADTNWSYIVPPGMALYPRGRCIIMTRSCKEPLYDGPNIYWHGQFPCPKLTLDPWPWTWLGKSPLKDVLTIQSAIDKTARGVMDKLEQYFKPGIAADGKTVSKAAMDRIDTRRPGLRIRSTVPGQPGVQILEPNMSGIPLALEVLQLLIAQGKEISGTQELTNLVQLGQIPSSETVERITESMSMATRLRSRVMETYMREVAMITLMNFFQFYTQKQRIAVLGEQGKTFEDFDFDPGTLVPDMGDPSRPRYERAKEFFLNFSFEIAPGSLLAAASVTDKMMYLQLTRMGIMDPATLMEKLGVPNLQLPGDFPEGVFPRMQWFAQQGQGLAVGPAGASAPASGRKATAQSSPRMVVKES